MDRPWKWRVSLVVMITLELTCLGLAAEEKSRSTVDLRQVKPKWDVGDRWVVETSTLPIQARREPIELSRGRPIPWQFTVQQDEKVVDDCYRVEIRCLLAGSPQPVTVLWIDKRSGALRQVQTQFPTADGFRTVTESYEPAGGQPSPVLSLLTALPVDLPAFQGNEAKGMEKYTYESRVGPAGVKNAGELGFAFEVEQEVTQPAAEQVKGLIKEDFTKDLTERPIVEVRLKGVDRQVRQLWQAGLPWPVYTDNGTTIARLVKVKPPEDGSEAE